MKFQTWLIIFLVLVIAGVIFYFRSCVEPERISETQVIHDTNTVVRYETKYEKQTEIKWFEKPFKKLSEPTTIYQQRIDTLKIREIIENRELMLGIEKNGTDLRVFALNVKNELLKEEVFHNVYSNFTAYSTENKVIVKSNLWEYKGVSLGYEHKRDISNIKSSYNHSVDLMTGVSFIDRYSADIGAEYNLTDKNIQLKAKLTARIF